MVCLNKQQCVANLWLGQITSTNKERIISILPIISHDCLCSCNRMTDTPQIPENSHYVEQAKQAVDTLPTQPASRDMRSEMTADCEMYIKRLSAFQASDIWQSVI